jgi:hypothetical protein
MVRRGLPTVVPVLVLVVMTACSSGTTPNSSGTTARPPTGHPSPPGQGSDALAFCRLALPGQDVVSGTWTTVGDLRAYGFSGPVRRTPLATAYPSAPASDRAAWCWTRDTPDSYTAWGARAPDDAQRAVTVNGPTDTTPSGPPIIP